jgi:photosystem II stability/assembly factor-like uncharacterized protein
VKQITRRNGLLGVLFAVTFAVVLIGCARAPSGQISSTDPFPATAHLVGMSFADQNDGIVIAEDCSTGGIGQAASACRSLPFTTSNGGQTWLAESRILLSPRAIQLVDAQNGWLIGSIGEQCGRVSCPNAIMETTDGGKSWQRAAMATSVLSDVRFVSAMNGWAVGQSCTPSNGCTGALVMTASGGQIWNNRPLPVSGQDIQLERAGTENAWAATIESGHAVIARTTDGGRTWQRLATPCQGSTITIDFPGEDEGWLVCNADLSADSSANVLYQSMDGAMSWQPVGIMRLDSMARHKTRIAAIDFISSEIGWAVDDQGHLAGSTDGGRIWTIRLNVTEPLVDVQFIGAKHGWVLGARHLWRTADGGKTWSQVSLNDAAIDHSRPARTGEIE